MTEKPHEQRKVLVWYLWPNYNHPVAFSCTLNCSCLPAVGLQEFLRSRFCSRGLQRGIGSWNTRWMFLWERDGASASVPSHHPSKDPSFTCAQCDNWEGVSWSWMQPAWGQQLLFHLSFLWHPIWTLSMGLEGVLRADEHLCCWETSGRATVISLLGVDNKLWVEVLRKYFYILTTNRGELSWDM